MVNSLRKGKRFEREIAKFLTIATGKKFNRTPQSGAMATRENIKDNRFMGDVFSNDTLRDVVIECKITQHKLSLNDFLNEKSIFWRWIKQTEKEAKDKRWLLFFKDGTRSIYLVIKKIITYHGTNLFDQKKIFDGFFDKILLMLSKFLKHPPMIIEKHGGEYRIYKVLYNPYAKK